MFRRDTEVRHALSLDDFRSDLESARPEIVGVRPANQRFLVDGLLDDKADNRVR